MADGFGWYTVFILKIWAGSMWPKIMSHGFHGVQLSASTKRMTEAIYKYVFHKQVKNIIAIHLVAIIQIFYHFTDQTLQKL